MTAPAANAPPPPIRLYRSSVIPARGFIHGFPERTGGVSVGPRSSLNLEIGRAHV